MSHPLPRPTVVPYVTAHRTEQPLGKVVLAPGGLGIAYLLEDVYDRDEHGVLWERSGLNRAGRPEFARLHPLRQRRAMHRLLCQVCGEPASRTEAGWLWLLGRDPHPWPGWPEKTAATHPPVCLPCADLARRLCPHLAAGYVALRARDPQPYGVHGLVYRRTGHTATPDHAATLAYGEAGIAWMRAAQAVRALHDCTRIDLDTELAATRRGSPHVTP
ncbi:hypothetical protein [Streptomyces sp. ODS28]|uniref:hypothetical protein n=1 Tax=Streptomyces sp. ODS28 TaxID=3136688 RepID=UPI0031F13455